MTPHALHGDTFSVRRQSGHTVATIGGDLTIASVPMVRERLLELLNPQASRIIIDLSGVTRCDASGLAVLLAAGRRARLLGGVLHLAAPAPPVAAVLRLTGLDSHFEIFATVLTAVGAPRYLPMSRLKAKRQRQKTMMPNGPVVPARGPGLPPQVACGTLGHTR